MNLLGRRSPRLPKPGEPLGPWGEREAARFLKKHRYRVLDRNVRSMIGEADLLCLAPDRRTHVVVEVKTRRDTTGDRKPEAAITAKKSAKLRRLVETIARQRGLTDVPWRIDVVAVSVQGDQVDIRHYVAAVTAS
ncbi:MAG: YraN family protein [Planctomycetota bacterium]